MNRRRGKRKKDRNRRIAPLAVLIGFCSRVEARQNRWGGSIVAGWCLRSSSASGTLVVLVESLPFSAGLSALRLLAWALIRPAYGAAQ